jgi:hypothetical protein
LVEGQQLTGAENVPGNPEGSKVNWMVKSGHQMGRIPAWLLRQRNKQSRFTPHQVRINPTLWPNSGMGIHEPRES